MEQCYNRGCGQAYNPAENSEEACRHHPGAPFFHDAYKGWSCCNKKSVDFTEFLNIKGCTLARHSNIKPPEPEKATTDNNSNESQNVVIEVREPIKVALPRPAIETPMVSVPTTIASSLKSAIDASKGSAVKPTTTSQAADGEVSVGTSCKNSGCNYSYTGTQTDYAECQYHPGVPIFHEGMKFWSCCQKRTSDFNVFMAQRGCTYGEHKWFKEEEDKKVVKCRYDWHQTASNVVVSIYAKMYHYELSKIEVNPIRLHVNLVFPEQDNAKFDLDVELRGIIVVKGTTAQMYGSKVEITMPKAEPGSWAKLDFPRAKLPPTISKTENINKQRETSADSDEDGFNLDDVETISSGLQLTELARSGSKNN